VAQQQLREPMTGAHQIHPDRLAGADQVAQRLLLIARNPDRMQLPRQQLHQVLRVPTIGLHPIPARARDLARRRHDALDAALGEIAREPVPSRAGLIRDPHRPRQPGAEADLPPALAWRKRRCPNVGGCRGDSQVSF
jgi:hypothetical protein